MTMPTNKTIFIWILLTTVLAAIGACMGKIDDEQSLQQANLTKESLKIDIVSGHEQEVSSEQPTKAPIIFRVSIDDLPATDTNVKFSVYGTYPEDTNKHCEGSIGKLTIPEMRSSADGLVETAIQFDHIAGCRVFLTATLDYEGFIDESDFKTREKLLSKTVELKVKSEAKYHLRVSTQHDNTETAGMPFSILLEVYTKNNNKKGNFNRDIELAFSFSSNPMSAEGFPPIIPPNKTVSFKNGEAVVFSDTLPIDQLYKEPFITGIEQLEKLSDHIILFSRDDMPKILVASSLGEFEPSSSEAITIIPNNMAKIIITDRPGKEGQEIYDKTFATNLGLFASGVDLYGNYVQEVEAEWSVEFAIVDEEDSYASDSGDDGTFGGDDGTFGGDDPFGSDLFDIGADTPVAETEAAVPSLDDIDYDTADAILEKALTTPIGVKTVLRPSLPTGYIVRSHFQNYSAKTGTLTALTGQASQVIIETEHKNMEDAGTPLRIKLSIKDANQQLVQDFNQTIEVQFTVEANISAIGTQPTYPKSPIPVAFKNGIGLTALTEEQQFIFVAAEKKAKIHLLPSSYFDAATEADNFLSGATIEAIEVRPGPLSYVDIIQHQGDAETVLTHVDFTVSADDTLVLGSIGLDAFGNFVGEFPAHWVFLPIEGQELIPIGSISEFNSPSASKTLKPTGMGKSILALKIKDKIMAQTGIVKALSGAPMRFHISTEHENVETAGKPFYLNITAYDVNENVAKDFDADNVLIHLTISDLQDFTPNDHLDYEVFNYLPEFSLHGQVRTLLNNTTAIESGVKYTPRTSFSQGVSNEIQLLFPHPTITGYTKPNLDMTFVEHGSKNTKIPAITVVEAPFHHTAIVYHKPDRPLVNEKRDFAIPVLQGNKFIRYITRDLELCALKFDAIGNFLGIAGNAVWSVQDSTTVELNYTSNIGCVTLSDGPSPAGETVLNVTYSGTSLSVTIKSVPETPEILDIEWAVDIAEISAGQPLTATIMVKNLYSEKISDFSGDLAISATGLTPTTDGSYQPNDMKIFKAEIDGGYGFSNDGSAKNLSFPTGEVNFTGAFVFWNANDLNPAITFSLDVGGGKTLIKSVPFVINHPFNTFQFGEQVEYFWVQQIEHAGGVPIGDAIESGNHTASSDCSDCFDIQITALDQFGAVVKAFNNPSLSFSRATTSGKIHYFRNLTGTAFENGVMKIRDISAYGTNAVVQIIAEYGQITTPLAKSSTLTFTDGLAPLAPTYVFYDTPEKKLTDAGLSWDQGVTMEISNCLEDVEKWILSTSATPPTVTDFTNFGRTCATLDYTFNINSNEILYDGTHDTIPGQYKFYLFAIDANDRISSGREVNLDVRGQTPDAIVFEIWDRTATAQITITDEFVVALKIPTGGCGNTGTTGLIAFTIDNAAPPALSQFTGSSCDSYLGKYVVTNLSDLAGGILSQGNHTIYGWIMNPGNVLNTALASQSFSYDSLAPSGFTVAIDNHIIATNVNTASFTISNLPAGEINSQITYTIASSGSGSKEQGYMATPPGRQITPIDLSLLGEGVLTLTVRIKDALGNESVAVMDNSKLLDKTPPNTFNIAFDFDINQTNLTAASASFSQCNDIGANYVWEISSSGDSGVAKVSGNGTVFSSIDQIDIGDLSSLPDGTLTLSVTLTDQALNQGTPQTNTAIKDVSAPSGYAIDFLTAGDINLTNQTSFQMQFTNAEIGTNYSYTITSSGGGNPINGSGAIAAADEIVTVNLTTMADGSTISVAAKLTDTVGNIGANVSGTSTSTKNTTKPGNFSVSFDANINDSNKTTASFTITGAEVATTYSYKIIDYLDAEIVANDVAAIPAGGNLTGTPIDVSSLADGPLRLYVWVTNIFGNPSSSMTDTADKDVSLPTIVNFKLFDDDKVIEDRTNSTYVRATITDTCEAGTTVLFTNKNDAFDADNGAWIPCNNADFYLFSSNFSTNGPLVGAVNDVTYTMYLWVKDTLGNISSTAASKTIKLVTAAPIAALTNPPVAFSSTKNLTVTVDNPGTLVAYKWKNVTGSSCTIDTYANGLFTNNIVYTIPSDGTYSLCVTVEDDIGNIQSTPTQITYDVDSTAPISTEVTLTGTPSNVIPTSPANLNITVGGANLAFYKYLLLKDVAVDATCDTSGYSTDWIDIGTPITDATDAGVEYGYKLCVITKDSATNAQPTSDAKTYFFTIDRQGPVISGISGGPNDQGYWITSSILTNTINVDGLIASDVYYYKYASVPCTDVDWSSATLPNEKMGTTGALNDLSTYYICAKAKDNRQNMGPIKQVEYFTDFDAVVPPDPTNFQLNSGGVNFNSDTPSVIATFNGNGIGVKEWTFSGSTYPNSIVVPSPNHNDAASTTIALSGESGLKTVNLFLTDHGVEAPNDSGTVSDQITYYAADKEIPLTDYNLNGKPVMALNTDETNSTYGLATIESSFDNLNFVTAIHLREFSLDATNAPKTMDTSGPVVNIPLDNLASDLLANSQNKLDLLFYNSNYHLIYTVGGTLKLAKYAKTTLTPGTSEDIFTSTNSTYWVKDPDMDRPLTGSYTNLIFAAYSSYDNQDSGQAKYRIRVVNINAATYYTEFMDIISNNNLGEYYFNPTITTDATSGYVTFYDANDNSIKMQKFKLSDKQLSGAALQIAAAVASSPLQISTAANQDYIAVGYSVGTTCNFAAVKRNGEGVAPTLNASITTLANCAHAQVEDAIADDNTFVTTYVNTSDTHFYFDTYTVAETVDPAPGTPFQISDNANGHAKNFWTDIRKNTVKNNMGLLFGTKGKWEGSCCFDPTDVLFFDQYK